INKPMLLENNTAGVLQCFLAEWRLNVRGMLPLQRMPLPGIGVPDEDLGDVVGVDVNRPAVTELPCVGACPVSQLRQDVSGVAKCAALHAVVLDGPGLDVQELIGEEGVS